jgi:hypothetical protein
MFKRMTPEEQEAADRAKAAADAEREARKREQQEARERAAYLASPVGLAETAFERGDHVFQYAQDVMSQEAVIVSMMGSTTRKTTSDASEILNAVCAKGWELVNGSFVFVTEGEQSRDKFMSSGQNVAVKGRTVGYYLFRRAPDRQTPGG